MKLRLLVCGSIVVAASVLVVTQVFSQDSAKKSETESAQRADMGPEQMAEAMKKWQAVASPGQHHEHLKQYVGVWNIEVKMWMGPEISPSLSHGVSETKLIMGGRFLQDTFEAEIEMPDPATGKMQKIAFEGHGLTGFDNYKKQYVGCWIDNMNTALFTSKGSYNPETKILTMYGEADEPGLDVHDRILKITTELVNKDKCVMKMYDLHMGNDLKVMEITYTRKK